MKYLSLLILLLCRVSFAQIAGPTGNDPVGVQQRLGRSVPLDIKLTDEAGQTHSLSSFLTGRPILLQFVYFGCPGLCTQSLNGLTRALNAMPESAGEQFDVLTISFDPHETPALAAEKKRSYLKGYRRVHAEESWHFLTADADAIRPLTKSLGFQYRWDVRTSSFAHPSMLAVLTPDGRISHYALSTEFDTGELHDALLRAGREQIGASAPAEFLYCLRYDPYRGRYSLIVARAVQAGALITFAWLASFIGISFFKEHRRRVN